MHTGDSMAGTRSDGAGLARIEADTSAALTQWGRRAIMRDY